MNIRTAALAVIALSSSSVPLQAQSAERAVMQVIDRLFDGMRAGDSTMLRSVFDAEARMVSVGTRDGEPSLNVGSVDRFVTSIGTPRDVVYDEPIWDWEVRIDGHLAQVWTKYAFYRGEDFSHCGVDAFQLVRRNEGWKIFQLTDTRRRDDCWTPPGR